MKRKYNFQQAIEEHISNNYNCYHNMFENVWLLLICQVQLFYLLDKKAHHMNEPFLISSYSYSLWFCAKTWMYSTQINEVKTDRN